MIPGNYLTYFGNGFIVSKINLFRFKATQLNNAKVAEQRVIREVFPSEARPCLIVPTTIPDGSSSQSSISNLVQTAAIGQTKKSLWSRQRQLVESTNSTKASTGSVVADGIIMIKEYNDMSLEDISVDPLQYWDAKRKCGVMVRLIPTIKKFFCVPATSVPSEQLFSKAGELISAKRNRLGKKNIDMLLFLNKNL